MASLPVTEDDYDFVEKPSGDFYCPITFELLREPFLTACCGNHLSKEAVTKLQGQPCPICKERNLNSIPDKYFKRKVNELQVRCHLGCEWVGELGSHGKHLRWNSVEGECQFVRVACPYSCGGFFQRGELQGHKADDCPSRPVTCQYCNYKAAYVEVTNEHVAICKKYPMGCPNKCRETVIERQHLLKHLEETCPLQVIKCEFSYAGCEVECQRQHMQTHLEEDVQSHLIKVSQCTVTLLKKTKQQQSVIEQLENVTQQQQKQIVALVYFDVQKPLVPVFITPPEIVMAEFVKFKKAGDWWHSFPFYSHIGGYKMCLCVVARGYGDGRGTHVSVFCYLNQGEYDDQLKWPFRGDVTIQLLNQSRDEGHWEKTIHFNDRSGVECSGRVVGRKRATGLGNHEFIAHTELNTENKEYLKNNCLKFRISNIVVKSI